MTLLGDKNVYEETELRDEYIVPSIYQEDADEELPLKSCVFISALLHPTVAGLAWLVVFLLALLGVNFELFHKPAQPPKDIEFVLVNKEAEPINKNTPYRADVNSRAGGIHDPKRPVSMPTPSAAPSKQQQKAAPQQKPAPQKQPVQQQKPKPAPKKQEFKMPWENKPVQKPAPTPKAPAPKAATPKAVTPAPRPALKPTSPKPTAKPQGNFNIPVPKTAAPKLAGAPGGPVTGARSGSSASKAGRGTGAPSPSFAPSSSSSGGRFSSSGSSGSRGNVGNPGPGNPKGAPGIDAVREPDFGPYMRELQRRIKMNWEPPKGNESKRVVLLFRIGRDGRLLSNKVLKSSGLAVADNAAKAAVELTAPFKPLPPEYKGSSVDIQFTFDYNVFGATSYY